MFPFGGGSYINIHGVYDVSPIIRGVLQEAALIAWIGSSVADLCCHRSSYYFKRPSNRNCLCLFVPMMVYGGIETFTIRLWELNDIWSSSGLSTYG